MTLDVPNTLRGKRGGRIIESGSRRHAASTHERREASIGPRFPNTLRITSEKNVTQGQRRTLD